MGRYDESIIVLYSKYSPECKDLITKFRKCKVEFDSICIDSEEVRDRIENDPDIVIEVVPTLLISYDGDTYIYSGDKSFAWLKEYVEKNDIEKLKAGGDDLLNVTKIKKKTQMYDFSDMSREESKEMRGKQRDVGKPYDDMSGRRSERGERGGGGGRQEMVREDYEDIRHTLPIKNPQIEAEKERRKESKPTMKGVKSNKMSAKEIASQMQAEREKFDKGTDPRRQPPYMTGQEPQVSFQDERALAPREFETIPQQKPKKSARRRKRTEYTEEESEEYVPPPPPTMTQKKEDPQKREKSMQSVRELAQQMQAQREQMESQMKQD
jgi:hypothetical protein